MVNFNSVSVKLGTMYYDSQIKLTFACSSFHLSASRSSTNSCHFARSSTITTSSTCDKQLSYSYNIIIIMIDSQVACLVETIESRTQSLRALLLADDHKVRLLWNEKYIFFIACLCNSHYSASRHELHDFHFSLSRRPTAEKEPKDSGFEIESVFGRCCFFAAPLLQYDENDTKTLCVYGKPSWKRKRGQSQNEN